MLKLNNGRDNVLTRQCPLLKCPPRKYPCESVRTSVGLSQSSARAYISKKLECRLGSSPARMMDGSARLAWWKARLVAQAVRAKRGKFFGQKSWIFKKFQRKNAIKNYFSEKKNTPLEKFLRTPSLKKFLTPLKNFAWFFFNLARLGLARVMAWLGSARTIFWKSSSSARLGLSSWLYGLTRLEKKRLDPILFR